MSNSLYFKFNIWDRVAICFFNFGDLSNSGCFAPHLREHSLRTSQPRMDVHMGCLCVRQHCLLSLKGHWCLYWLCLLKELGPFFLFFLWWCFLPAFDMTSGKTSDPLSESEEDGMKSSLKESSLMSDSFSEKKTYIYNIFHNISFLLYTGKYSTPPFFLPLSNSLSVLDKFQCLKLSLFQNNLQLSSSKSIGLDQSTKWDIIACLNYDIPFGFFFYFAKIC